MRRQLLFLVLLFGLLGLVGAPSAMAGPVDDAPPSTIRVCRGDGSVDTVPFKEYVKVVLPVEFFASWPQETLLAGAAVIKSYAWYFVRHPISERCDIGDSTRNQVYAPEKQRRTARSDAAVEDSWHLRMWDPERGDIAFAQYCSAGCRTHKRNAGEGRYMDQNEAEDYGNAGWTHLEMLHHFYRNLPMELTDWTDGLAMSTTNDVLRMDNPETLHIRLAGVTPGDTRVQLPAYALCTIDGERRATLLEVGRVTDAGDGVPEAVFDNLDGLSACVEDEASVHIQMVVNGHAAMTFVVQSWRRWVSEEPREVARVADVDGAVLASVIVSEQTFPAQQPRASDEGVLGTVLNSDDEDNEPAELAEFAVLARSDKFPDALGATALAGVAGPILLHPSGPDARLNATVADEMVRALAPGSTVHIVGGPNAISTGTEQDVADLGFVPVRTAGTDRILTALALADRVVGEHGGNGRAIIVRGFPNDTRGWADAVSVGPWAAASSTPVLISRPDAMPAEVKVWLEDPANGIEEVLVIGGPRAISEDVVGALEGVKVTRVHGTRRDETSLAVAEELWGTRGSPRAEAVVVQNVFEQTGWPFAVVGSVPAARENAAAVSVWEQVPPSTTGEWLDESAPRLPALVIGGPIAVPDSVEAALSGA